MYFSPNNSGDSLEQESPSHSPIPKYSIWFNHKGHGEVFFTLPQGEVIVFIYMLQKLGHEEDLYLEEEEPNSFSLQLRVNLALQYHLQYFAFSQLSGSAKHHVWILPLPFAGHLFQPSSILHQCYPGVPA